VKNPRTGDVLVFERGTSPRRTEEWTVSSELVERAQRGDHEAFDALATAAYHRLYAIARRILRDGYAAEDAVQDALVRAWREIRGLRDPGAFNAWLHRLLVNACRDHVRRTRRRVVEVLELPIDRPDPRNVVDRFVDRDELERAFLELSLEHRAVLVLTHYVGLPAAEVAAILAIPPGTVASRLHYGARLMRSAIERAAAVPATSPERGR
jgi:RNA polymerase sigma-70 factor (ECF subfamily)